MAANTTVGATKMSRTQHALRKRMESISRPVETMLEARFIPTLTPTNKFDALLCSRGTAGVLCVAAALSDARNLFRSSLHT